MRFAIAAAAAIGLSALAAPALAAERGFTAEVNAPLNAPIGAITVGVDEDIVTRNALRARTRGGRSNDYIGPGDAERLIAALEASLNEGLQGVGALQPMAGQPVATLEARIVRVVPTNPGLTEFGLRRQLSAFSTGYGGAEVEAVLRGPNGEEVATYSYRSFESLRDDQSAFRARAGAWTDAERAFDRFAERLAADLSGATHAALR